MKKQVFKDDWGRDDLMVIAAFRYCLGRSTYIVSDCVEWLLRIWPKLNENTKSIIKRDLEKTFQHDDSHLIKDNKSNYKMLGMDCDRQEWEKVREL